MQPTIIGERIIADGLERLTFRFHSTDGRAKPSVGDYLCDLSSFFSPLKLDMPGRHTWDGYTFCACHSVVLLPETRVQEACTRNLRKFIAPNFDASSCTNFKFGRYIQSVNALKSVKNLGEKGAWTYPGTAQFFWVPHIISGTGKATKFKFGRYIHRLHACEQKPLKNLGEKGALAYPGTSQIFKYPLLSQERLKLYELPILYARSKYRSEQTPITNFEKSSRGLVRTLEIFRGTHILGASRGRLCDSSGFLLY